MLYFFNPFTLHDGSQLGSASAEETSSWLNIGSTRRGSKGGVFFRMQSRRASPSSVALWVNEPLAVLSSCRADSLLRPSQKCCNGTWLGIDSLGRTLLGLKNGPRLHLWFPSLFVGSWGSLVVGQWFWIYRRMRDRICSSVLPNHQLPSLQCGCTIVLPSHHQSVSCDMPEMVRQAQSCSNSCDRTTQFI